MQKCSVCKKTVSKDYLPLDVCEVHKGPLCMSCSIYQRGKMKNGKWGNLAYCEKWWKKQYPDLKP